MLINGIQIDDTFAEAFNMRGTRVIITAQNLKWAYHAANAMTGFATSVIGCGVEAGIERELSTDESPDGRPGVSILMFAMGSKVLMQQLETRMGQCILTCPTAAAFAGIEGEDKINLGKNLRYFGDGFQTSKLIDGKRYWRIPVMDGEFLTEETTGMVRAIGGGNFLILATSQPAALAVAEAAVEAMKRIPNVIMPFPGGVVRSGSKVGSKYKTMFASTNDAFCPTLKGATNTELSPEIESVMEIVIDGLTFEDIALSMKVGIETICNLGAECGVKRISAGNYGGKLGPHLFKLHDILNGNKS
ncbi:MAG: formylmethanofuran--tetrahydromethanopterin N-formyltransferase [Methylotenera sp.]|nr:formylmethanofuran--tetrahydromethanopterin N-formyltransferase [Methylotenera sp.]MDO9232092.1 formylmethanofuran--tetrahydromethanopterin N-formyltransferase [Methylotenera sp.]MDP2101341.1 formylmethanofuran--tetrahydromethanopterin N-formyltransferase [Methylotenera sp.]MDP2281620.1 formylmethanofuran--tetrahydromethanopterin N-formyltransferase [Methylotenera sp.]MDP2402785.1 formylmethanofuran--tetrahydromethanopterin N-formyltransferase [Methylotenera sp.]